MQTPNSCAVVRRCPSRRAWKLGVGFLAVAAMAITACTSSDEDTSTTTVRSDATTTASDAPSTSAADDATTTTSTPIDTAPITLGVTHVDVESLTAVGLDYDLGQHAAVYEALVADINDSGGINGRLLELRLAPVDPTGSEGGEAACIELIEDHEADLLTGFFLNDAVLCPAEQQDTPVVGGNMTPDRVERATAPWITWTRDWQGPEDAIRTLAEQGELDGAVAVYVDAADQAQMDATVLPVLDELEIEPVEIGVMDAPASDTAATQASVEVIGERFESAGADTVLLVGASAENWPTYMSANQSYRPTLLFLDQTGSKAFAVNESTADTTVLEGSLSASGYGPDQARFEEATMQQCLTILEAAGIESPSPDEAGDDPSYRPYEAAFQACPDMWLVRALLEASGGDVSHEALTAAADGLEVTVPGDPGPRVYGPAPSADGDPATYLFAWDEAAGDFVLADG